MPPPTGLGEASTTPRTILKSIFHRFFFLLHIHITPIYHRNFRKDGSLKGRRKITYNFIILKEVHSQCYYFGEMYFCVRTEPCCARCFINFWFPLSIGTSLFPFDVSKAPQTRLSVMSNSFTQGLGQQRPAIWWGTANWASVTPVLSPVAVPPGCSSPGCLWPQALPPGSRDPYTLSGDVLGGSEAP